MPILERNYQPTEASQEVSPIYRSSRIRKFLASVQPGKAYGFFDMDQTLWQAGVDAEDLAFQRFGLIDSARFSDWKQKILDAESLGSDQHLVSSRSLNLAYYPRIITSELARHTGMFEGNMMNPDVLRELGKPIGRHIVEQLLYRPVAMDVLRECAQQQIDIVILTATPIELAEGVLEAASTQLDLPEMTVIGTEDNYYEGTVTEIMRMMGQNKTEVVRAAKHRGGKAIIGAGDKFLTSDAFIHECRIKGHIDTASPDGGDIEWQRVYESLREHRTK
jgi:phosphoserine phosphatase